MFTNEDFLNYYNLNDIEEEIKNVYNKFSSLISYDYTKKEWLLNEYSLIDDIKKIEEAIDKIGKEIGYPIGWIETKKWGKTGNISYQDINRWINNLEILLNQDLTKLLLPSDTLYPSNTLLPTNTGKTRVIIRSIEFIKSTNLYTNIPYIIQSTKIKGNSIQNGTPTPDNPVEIETINGYNLLKPPTSSTVISNGITFTVEEDGTVILNGTNNNNGNSTIFFDFNNDNPLNLKNGELYTLSGINNSNISFVMYNGKSYTNLADKTFTANGPYFAAYLQVPKGNTTTFTDFKVYPTLVKGYLTNYIPYKNIAIKTCGKNLFDLPNPIIIDAILTTLKVNLKAGSYVISYGSMETTGAKNFLIRFFNSDGSGTDKYIYLTNNIKSINFNSENDYNRMSVYSQSGYAPSVGITSTIYDLMLSKNGGEYEPYKENTSYIDLQNYELCKVGNVYDELNIKNGKAILTKRIGKVVLDGSENWRMSTSTITNLTAFWFYKSSYPSLNIKENSYNKLSNFFLYKKEEWNKVISPCLCENSGLTTNMILFSGFSNIQTISDWEFWLSTHNTEIYYELEKPQEIELDVIYNPDLFKGENNVIIETNIETTSIIDYVYDVERDE